MNQYIHEKALIGAKARIGQGTRVWAFANVLDGAQIGDNCNICDGCFIESQAVIGNNVTVKNNVAIYDGITLEDNVFVGPQATFINDRYPRSRKPDWTLEKTLVKKGATLGANCTILCGVTIGEYAVVGAGAVVIKDVPAHAVFVGNPAHQTGWADQEGRPLNDKLESTSGRKYRLTEKGLESI